MLDVHFMLDSGAFTVWRQGGKINLLGYARYVRKLRRKYGSRVVPVNLDVIGDGEGSYKNWIKLRDEGATTLPVYHLDTPVKYLEMYLEQTDYVALGKLAYASGRKRRLVLDHLWTTYLLRPDRMPKYRIHGLGMASFPLLSRYPWYSVDTTNCLYFARVGAIWVPRRGAEGWNFRAPPLQIQCDNPLRWRGRLVKGVLSTAELKSVTNYLRYIGFTVAGIQQKGPPGQHLRELANERYYYEVIRRLEWPRPYIGGFPRMLF